jgi:hypothetical protein
MIPTCSTDGEVATAMDTHENLPQRAGCLARTSYWRRIPATSAWPRAGQCSHGSHGGNRRSMFLVAAVACKRSIAARQGPRRCDCRCPPTYFASLALASYLSATRNTAPRRRSVERRNGTTRAISQPLCLARCLFQSTILPADAVGRGRIPRPAGRWTLDAGRWTPAALTCRCLRRVRRAIGCCAQRLPTPEPYSVRALQAIQAD